MIRRVFQQAGNAVTDPGHRQGPLICSEQISFCREDSLNDADLYAAPEVASKMLVAAMGLIETLTPVQRDHLVLPLDHPARQDWDIIPRPEGTGLSLHDLSRSQKILVWDLLAAALPLRTFTQTTQIPQLEHVLRDYEAGFLGRAIGAWRDPNNYWVTIFGRPGFEDTFAVRFYGHHLGINLTVIKERWIVAGPSAMGQQPVVYDGTNKPLVDEETAAFAIVNSLTDEQTAKAIIHPVSRRLLHPLRAPHRRGRVPGRDRPGDAAVPADRQGPPRHPAGAFRAGGDR